MTIKTRHPGLSVQHYFIEPLDLTITEACKHSMVHAVGS
jgi:hypothetical protein